MSSTKYYKDNKKRLQIELVEDIKVFLKKEKKESNIMVLSDTKIYQKKKNKSWLSIERNTTKCEKTPYYFCLEDLFFLDEFGSYAQAWASIRDFFFL